MADKKRKFAGSIAYGQNTEADLGTLARANPEQFMSRCEDLIEKGELTSSSIRSLGRLYDQLDGVEVKHSILDPRGNSRTITSAAFPLLTGSLIVKEVNQGMEGIPTVGQELVTESDDPKAWSHYAGILVDAPHQKQVRETEPFPEIEASAERYDIGHLRNGFKMSITAEAIEENEWPQIAMKANRLGEVVEEVVEEQTLSRVCDQYGSATSAAEPYVLRLNNTARSLYTTTNSILTRLSSSGNRITNNALTDETDLEIARARLASFTNERGKRIAVPMSRMVLLVPDALVGTASKILGSEMVPGVENELNNWGPRGAYRPRFRSTPKLDDISTTAWYLGWFEKQFVRKWATRAEYVELGETTESYLRSRVAYQARLAWNMEIGVQDHVYVVQSLSASTAPTAANVP